MELTDLPKIFSTIADPRIERRKLHRLDNILTIALCATLCGATDFHEIAAFGIAKRNFLGQFLDLANGIPSHDTFNRVFKLIKPAAFLAVLQEHTANVWATLRSNENELELLPSNTPPITHLSIDGKCLLGTNESGTNGRKGNKCQNIVTVWTSQHRLVLAQEQVANKSNEITALPRLLEQIDLQNTVVTIDAMGCQKEIAAQIDAAGGTYLLAVKNNQPTLHMEIERYFEQELSKNTTDIDEITTDISAFEQELIIKQDTAENVQNEPISTENNENNEQDNTEKVILDTYQHTDLGHGRIETRSCQVSTDLSTIYVANAWQGLSSIIQVKRQSTNKKTGIKRKDETQYYICNKTLPAKQTNQIIRDHWGIENGLHWQLDVTFREDANMTTNRNAVQNLNTMRKFVLQILQHCEVKKKSKKVIIKSLAWNDDLLLKILKGIQL